MDDLQVDLEILKIEVRINTLLKMRMTLNDEINKEIEKLEHERNRIKKDD